MKNKPVPQAHPPAPSPCRMLEYVQLRDGTYLGPDRVELITEARCSAFLIVLEADPVAGPTVMITSVSTGAHARVPLPNVAAYRVAL